MGDTATSQTVPLAQSELEQIPPEEGLEALPRTKAPKKKMISKINDGDTPSDDEEIEIVPTWSYVTKKTISSGILNVSLLISNAVQLKALYGEDQDSRDAFWSADVALVFISLILQFLTAILLFVLSVLTPKKTEHMTAVTILNNVSVAMVLLITIVNVIISGFGIHLSGNTIVPSPTNATVHNVTST